MKALGTGWRGGLGWRDLEVANLRSGRPTLDFTAWPRRSRIDSACAIFRLSMTHTVQQAMAMVILES